MKSIKQTIGKSVQYAKEHVGALIGAIITIPAAILYSTWEDTMPTGLAIIFSIAFVVIAYLIIVVILAITKQKPIINKMHVVLVVSVGLAILFGYSAGRNRLEIQTIENLLIDSHSTQAVLSETIVAMQTTIVYQATQHGEHTPSPEVNSIEDLSPCDFEKKNYPCKYWTVIGDYSSKLALAAYGNSAYAGKIAELYRNEKGTIPIFRSDQLIIVPNHTLQQDENYYNYYLGLLNPPILKCKEPTFMFPCWLISEGESYDALASHYPNQITVDCIRAANKTEWNAPLDRLDPKLPEVGSIFVLPVCP